MSKFFSLIPATLAVLALLLSAPAQAQQGRQGEAATHVSVDRVQLQIIDQTQPIIGRVVARHAGEVSARIEGPVQEIAVKVGDRVKKGDVLVRLADATLKAKRDLAQARLNAEKAAHKGRQADARLRELELARLARLSESAAFSQARYEDQIQTVANANALVEESQALILSAQADLNLAQIELNYTAVKAPYDGVITARLTDEGAFLSRGDGVLEMIGTSDLEIEAEIPATLLSGLQEGRLISYHLGDGDEHMGAIRAVVPNEDPLTRTRQVRISTNPEELSTPLIPGQSITLLVPTALPRQALTVPKDALLPGPGGYTLYIVRDGVALPRRVELGKAVGSRMEVSGGLDDGDLIVVRGNERLRPGEEVEITNQNTLETPAAELVQ